MPRCKNCPSPPSRGYYYTGNENTPRGRGYCALFEREGKKMIGNDGKYYIVKNNRWVSVISSSKKTSPRMMMRDPNQALRTHQAQRSAEQKVRSNMNDRLDDNQLRWAVVAVMRYERLRRYYDINDVIDSISQIQDNDEFKRYLERNNI